MKLHDFELSGNCYKVRLLLALLALPWERAPVDLTRGEESRPGFLRLNPRGQVPVLEDGDTVIWDSQAILVYIARRYAGEDWLPLEPAALAAVTQWLAFAGNEILFGLARARAIARFARPGDAEDCRAMGTRALKVLEHHLRDRAWLALERPTIADIACYPYVGLAPEGGVELDAVPRVRAWLARIEALPRYVPMPGLPAAGSR